MPDWVLMMGLAVMAAIVIIAIFIVVTYILELHERMRNGKNDR
jgi:uncharacterized membrane protein